MAITESTGLYSFDLQLICAKYGLETFALQVTKFVLFTTNRYRKLSENVTSDKWSNLFNYEWLAAKLCWMRATNPICTKSKKSWFGTRHTASLWQIRPGNKTLWGHPHYQHKSFLLSRLPSVITALLPLSEHPSARWSWLPSLNNHGTFSCPNCFSVSR
jgi:hypothetical protein